MDQRQKLIGLIDRQIPLATLNLGAGPRLTVSLEDFFTDNEDYGSIGCNLNDHPGPQEFFRILRQIRTRPEVKDILVGIASVEEPDPGGAWPFSETVYVVTTASDDQVREWAQSLQPDEVGSVGIFAYQPYIAAPPPPYRIVMLWWD